VIYQIEEKQMAKKSKIDYFKVQIEDLLKKGASIRSTWKIVNADLPEYAKFSYTAFLYYVRKNIQLHSSTIDDI
jgi:hypothetical protein